jgi:hypothetical protein
MPVMYLAGKAIEVPDDQVQAALDQQYTLESPEQHAQRLTGEQRESDFGGVKGKVAAGTAALARGASLGLSDVAIDALSGGANNLSDLREVNPGVSLAGEALGALSPVGPAAWAARIGSGIAETAEGASLATRLTRGAAGYGAEGGLQGLGQGVSELALSNDPLTAERIASVLTSNTLLGGGIGAAAGTVGKLAEHGLLKAKGALDELAAGSRIGQDVAGDLAGMGSKELRAAEQAEHASIEAARVPQRADLANEIAGLRKEMKDQKVWLATKGAKTWEGVEPALAKEASEIGKVSLEADKTLDRMLRNPKALAARPQRALDALQQQESALERLAAQKDSLAGVFAKDASGERMAALESAGKALDRNRQLQQRIGDLVKEPTSERLAAITNARDALSAPKAAAPIGEKMASGAAYSMAAGAAGSIPFVGPFIAPFVGNAAAAAVGGKLSGKLAKGVAESAERTSKAVSKFLEVSAPIARAAPVLATKVLGAVRYSDAKEPKPPKKAPRDQLAANYHARSEELRSQTVFSLTGQAVMRPDARMKMADRLDPVRHIDPVLADRLETLQARRVEFLASKLPRRPDLVAIKTGPDRWQPSDMEMRQFARYVAGVEDPDGIEDRLAAGSVTPEDADVMRNVYPERYAAITSQIAAKLPELRASLPYQRRLALSVFSGVPVDPAMHPRILAVLQSSFAEEPGSEGGTQAPKPQPAFGSVKNQEATPSQARQEHRA